MVSRLYRFNFLLTIQAIYISVIPISMVILSYFRVDIYSSLLFRANDTQCDPKVEGFGIHCFGDFHEGLVKYSYSKTLEYQNHYWLSPMDGVISKISTTLNSLLQERTILIGFLILYFLVLTIPLMDIWKNQKVNKLELLVGMIYLGSLPFLASLDRMNSICLLAPASYYFFCQILRKNSNWITLSFVIMCAFKPQLLILSIAIGIVLGAKFALKCLVLSASGIVLLVCAQHRFEPSAVGRWISVVVGYGSEGLSISRDYPNNISFARGIYYVSNRIGFPDLSEAIYILCSILFSVTVAVLIVFLRKKIGISDVVFAILAISVLGFSKVTYPYYLLLFLILEMARFRTSSSSIFSREINESPVNLSIHLRKFLFIVILSPLPVPIFGYFANHPYQEFSQNTLPILNPVLVSVIAIMTLILIVKEGFKRFVP